MRQWDVRDVSSGTGFSKAEEPVSQIYKNCQESSRNLDKIHRIVYDDRQRTINKNPDTVGLSYGIMQEIPTFELRTLRVSANFVLRLLTTEDREDHVEVCHNLHQRAADDPFFMSRILVIGVASRAQPYDEVAVITIEVFISTNEESTTGP